MVSYKLLVASSLLGLAKHQACMHAICLLHFLYLNSFFFVGVNEKKVDVVFEQQQLITFFFKAVEHQKGAKTKQA